MSYGGVITLRFSLTLNEEVILIIYIKLSEIPIESRPWRIIESSDIGKC